MRASTITMPGCGGESNREMNKLLDAIGRRDGGAASFAHVKRPAELALGALAQQDETTRSA